MEKLGRLQTFGYKSVILKLQWIILSRNYYTGILHGKRQLERPYLCSWFCVPPPPPWYMSAVKCSCGSKRSIRKRLKLFAAGSTTSKISSLQASFSFPSAHCPSWLPTSEAAARGAHPGEQSCPLHSLICIPSTEHWSAELALSKYLLREWINKKGS